MMKQVKKALSQVLYIILFFILIYIFSTQAFASADNSLSLLKIEGVELTPKFRYNHLKYSGTLNSNKTKVDIKTKTSNKRARVISISGNTNLKEGLNNIKIVVQAQNNKKATYEIALTKVATTENNDDNFFNEDEEDTQADVSEGENKDNVLSENQNNAENDLVTAGTGTEEKPKNKKEQIKELKKEIKNSNQAYEALNTKYTDTLKDNEKLRFRNNVFIILSILFFCLLLVSLFINLIKNNTKKYLNKEFSDFDDIKDNRKKVNIDEIKDVIYDIENLDSDEYGKLSTKANIYDDSDDIISNKTVKANDFDLEFNDIEKPYNKAENTEHIKNNNVEPKENKDEKESFTFDIIDL